MRPRAGVATSRGLVAAAALGWLLGCGGGTGPSGSGPSVTSLSPSSGTAGTSTQLTVEGAGFQNGSVIQWNGYPLNTTFQDANHLFTNLGDAEVRRPGTGEVRVDNGASGGGFSNQVDFQLRFPVPVVNSVTPSTLPTTAASVHLTVLGGPFYPETRVRFGGSDRPFTLIGPGGLDVVLAAGDLSTPRVTTLTVSNPSPGGGDAPPVSFAITKAHTILAQRAVTLQLAHLAFEPVHQRLLGLTAVGEPITPNALVAIDPVHATVDWAVSLPFEPDLVVTSADGHWAYVSAKSDGVVARVNLDAPAIDLSFRVDGFGKYEPTVAGGLAIVPGDPHTVLVAIRSIAVTPDHEGYVAFRDGQPLAGRVGRALRSNQLLPGTLAGEVLGFGDPLGGPFTIFRLRVDGAGVAIVSQREYLGYGGLSLGNDGGQLITDTGTDIDIASGNVRSSLQLTGQLPFASEAAVGRFYRLVPVPAALEAYDLAQLVSVGPVSIAGIGIPQGDLVRWSHRGLAFRTVTQVVIVETDQADP